MKLRSVNVSHFRNIVDSSDVRVEDDVTCLVGKNESGKTSFLQALYRLNPDIPTPFDVQQHYPAWLEKAHRLHGKNLPASCPVTAVFELDDEERAEFVAECGSAVAKVNEVKVLRTYAGSLQVDIAFDEHQWVKDFIHAHGAALSTGRTVPKTAKQFADWLSELKNAAPDQADANHAAIASQVLTQLHAACGKELDPATSARKWLVTRVPKFLYVSRYDLLPGIIDIHKVANNGFEGLTEGERVAKALLALAYADPKEAMSSTYERRKRELENTANALTMEILEYWTQNEDIRVEVDFDQDNVNNQAVVKRLHVRLYDNEHMLSLPFGERSSGFQWFFSFLCAFSRYALSKEPVILLLDEPALALHARAQADFLRYIEEKLAPRCQVIYTTHSPFMVQPKYLSRVRLVEDKGRKVGAKVSDDVLTTDADTLFPLQGALGYDLAQNLLVGPYNLIVEGTSDLVYLQLVGAHLSSKGRTALDGRCTIVPVGGAEKVPTFVALLGSHVDATVLVDSAKKGNQRLDQLVTEGILKRQRVIGVGEISSAVEADIEDLFEPSEYLALFNAAFGTKFKVADLTGNDPIVRRLARLQQVDRFDHGRPAAALLRNKGDLLEKLSEATLARFEKLFTRVNATFG